MKLEHQGQFKGRWEPDWFKHKVKTYKWKNDTWVKAGLGLCLCFPYHHLFC